MTISLTKTTRPSLVKAPRVKVTQHELCELLHQIPRRATFATVVYETVPQLVGGKSNPYAGRVKKVSRINCVLNFIYENAVNNQRAREGVTEEFHSEPRSWGVRVAGTPLITHKGGYYLEVKVERVYQTDYYIDNVRRPNGAELLSGQIRPISRNESSRQGVESQVILRDINLNNIKYLKMNGVEYIVS